VATSAFFAEFGPCLPRNMTRAKLQWSKQHQHLRCKSSNQAVSVTVDVRSKPRLSSLTGALVPKAAKKKFSTRCSQWSRLLLTASMLVSSLMGRLVRAAPPGSLPKRLSSLFVAGSGKTFTMEGTPSNRGVYFRALASLFAQISHRAAEYSYSLKVWNLNVSSYVSYLHANNELYRCPWWKFTTKM
jgi:hypothetical protein